MTPGFPFPFPVAALLFAVEGDLERGLFLFWVLESAPRYLRSGGGTEYLVKRKSMGLRGLGCDSEGIIKSQIMACEGGDEGVREG